MILLDTDVTLDAALDRDYLLRPSSATGSARAFLEALTTFALAAPTATDDFRAALAFPIPDPDHALPAAAAPACGARDIATRNTRDFEPSPVPAPTPKELLEVLGGR